ncbi:MAG: NYN domain-containing protein [Chlorobiaceae bacterium]|nr:NYN domain-containing protein [Chlorobiaceae bacterium]
MKKVWHEYVIDGYNLLNCLFPSTGKRPLEKLRHELEKKLKAFLRASGSHLTVVYDGKGRFREQASGAPLHIVFTPTSKSADEWIVDYVKSLNTKIKLVTIVSSDNELRTCASAFGARNMKSEEFAELINGGQLAAGLQRNGPDSRSRVPGEKSGCGELCEKEIERWKKLFQKGGS